MVLDMDLELKFGQMAQSTKENGNSTKLTEKGNSGTQMAISTKVFGRKTKLMDMVFMCT